MTVSTLPDVCLLAVIDRIPLQQVDTLGLVCRRWNSLQPIIYNRRRSLVLLISQNSNGYEDNFVRYCYRQFRNPFKDPGYVNEGKLIDQQKISLFEFSTLENFHSNWLVATFPNITNLVILHDTECDLVERNSEETTQLIALLKHWSGKLKSLKYIQFDFIFEYNPVLLDTINSMSALKRLWLVLNFDDKFEESQIDLTVLTQLDQFYVDSDFKKFPNSAIRSVQKYASVMNSNMKIAINTSDDMKVENLFRFNDQLANRFVACDFDFNSNINLMQKFYLKFTSLTNVFVNMNNVKLSQLCLCLSPLKNLKYLTLFASSYEDYVNFDEEDNLSSSNFPPLTSVRILDLGIVVNSHLDFNSIHLPAIFPNVQLVYVDKENGSCVICGIEYDDHPTEEDRTCQRYQSCFQQLVQPFRMLPKLEKIVDRSTQID